MCCACEMDLVFVGFSFKYCSGVERVNDLKNALSDMFVTRFHRFDLLGPKETDFELIVLSHDTPRMVRKYIKQNLEKRDLFGGLIVDVDGCSFMI